jgi:hypothetical protein
LFFVGNLRYNKEKIMTKKTKILIGILVIVVLVCGWQIWIIRKGIKKLPLKITYEKIMTCSNDSECYCCDGLGMGKQHPLTFAYEEAHANVCINKNYLDKGYEIECQHNIEDEKTFCGTHQCKCENNKCVSTLKPPFTEEVLVYTNKKEYEQGEIVKVTIKNNLPEGKPIWYNCIPITIGRNQPLPLIVFKYTDGEWINIYEDPSIKHPQDICQHGSGIPIEFQFIGGIYKDIFKDSGKYKIGFVYTLDKSAPAIDWLTSYSNEFTVREKKTIDLETCNKIADRYRKDECYVNIAITKQDSTICKEIEDPIYKNWCSKTIQKQILAPEEVACGFFHWYIYEGGSLEERTDVTEEYKRKIAQIRQEIIGPGYDPVIFAQDLPDKGFKVGKAIIQDKNASLKVTLIWSGSDFGHVLKVDLIMENNQWKINNITYLEGDITWETYQNENYGYQINYPDFWSFIKDEPKNIVLSNCPTKEEICMQFSIDILSDTGGGNLDDIKEVKSLKAEGWNYEYTTVSGIKSIKLVRPCSTYLGACTAPELTRYYIIKGAYTYRIEFETGYAGCRICDQMLSTFRFLE